MNIIPNRLRTLRAAMAAKSIDAIIIPSSDPHQSEYVANHWQERSWISGFTGSAGLVVVTADEAGLWTDSRYFLQGEQELAGTTVQLHKMINQFGTPYIDFIVDSLGRGSTVAINPWMFAKAQVNDLQKSLGRKGIILNTDFDLISEVWTDRPALSQDPIFIHDVKYTGMSAGDKLDEVSSQMKAKGADFHLVTALDDIAWVFNIRGSDVDYNPVAIAYGLIGKGIATLFINEAKITAQVRQNLNDNNIELIPYEDIVKVLNEMSEQSTILVDETICNDKLYNAINAKIIHGTSIPKLLKGIKSTVEIAHVKEAMKKDGAAIAHTFYNLELWLKNGISTNECKVAEELAHNRSQQADYFGESFGAIIGYKGNGAIIHYHPMPDTCKTLSNDGILLIDSGGQYSDGTTDITRTLTLGNTSQKQKKCYTLILKGMLELTMAKFPVGTSGAQLDTLARHYLWNNGLNYGHGTGHGVGFFLNVHEPPQGFAPFSSERGRTIQEPGMLSSNEPGYYLEGEFGMRIENLIVTNKSSFEGFLEFETVTLYPFEHALIELTLLSLAEIDWINTYHKECLDKISPFIKSAEVKEWFVGKCRTI